MKIYLRSAYAIFFWLFAGSIASYYEYRMFLAISIARGIYILNWLFLASIGTAIWVLCIRMLLYVFFTRLEADNRTFAVTGFGGKVLFRQDLKDMKSIELRAGQKGSSRIILAFIGKARYSWDTSATGSLDLARFLAEATGLKIIGLDD
ncbi:MAG: hypothetical protein JSS72_04590 [Armatimonadetes bacterium]|nr:hypothetical protein [Armatimonadota bacterium]